MEKIRLSIAATDKLGKPEYQYQYFYRADEVDDFLASVRELVEAAKRRDDIDNICRDGWDIFRAKVDLKQAIASVERLMPKC